MELGLPSGPVSGVNVKKKKAEFLPSFFDLIPKDPVPYCVSTFFFFFFLAFLSPSTARDGLELSPPDFTVPSSAARLGEVVLLGAVTELSTARPGLLVSPPDFTAPSSKARAGLLVSPPDFTASAE